MICPTCGQYGYVKNGEKSQNEKERAIVLLKELLKDSGMPAVMVFRAGEKEMISRSSMLRAKHALGVYHIRAHSEGRFGFWWNLPGSISNSTFKKRTPEAKAKKATKEASKEDAYLSAVAEYVRNNPSHVDTWNLTNHVYGNTTTESRFKLLKLLGKNGIGIADGTLIKGHDAEVPEILAFALQQPQ